MTLRLAAVLLGLVVLAAPASAQVEPQLKVPYNLTVVVHVAAHRSLTPLFQEQLEREVGNQLRLALGALAKVQVVREHALLPEIETHGLKQALAGWEKVEDRQVYFLLLNYAAGTYQLEVGHHDGMTGQAGPLVRQAATSDRTAVAQLAAERIEHDFAPVGTVMEVQQEGKSAQLAIKGGGLGVSLERWVRPGDIFSVSRVQREPTGLRASRVPWALLEVVDAPRDGVCRCRYYHRFDQDQLQVGFRAVKLPATQGRVRLRLRDRETSELLDGRQVRVTRPGSAKKVDLTTDRAGLAVTREDFTHWALVQVLSGDRTLAQFPVAILDDRPVECLVTIRPEADALAPLEFRRDAWVRRILDDLLLANQRVTGLKAQVSKSLQGALKEGQGVLKSMDEELASLAAERDDLLGQARKRTPPAQLDLREGDQRLHELRQQQENLQQFVKKIEEVLAKAASPETQRLKQMIAKAQLLESEARFDEAINTYREVLKASPDETEVRDYLQRLEKAWAIQNEAHAKARQFMYETWPNLDLAGLKDNLEQARQALAVCKAAGDRLSPQMLQRANAEHASRLAKQVAALKRQSGEDSENQARALAQVAQGMRRLLDETAAWLAEKAK